MQLPNSKTLPYYVIALLVSALGGLCAAYVEQANECKAERREMQSLYDAKIAECHAETKNATIRLEDFLKEQATRDREFAAEIRKLKAK